MPEDTLSGLLSEPASVGATKSLPACLAVDTETERRQRARADRLEARRLMVNSAPLSPVHGMAGGQMTGRGPREQANVRFAARVVPALNESVDSGLWGQLVDKSPIIHTAARGLIYSSATRPAMLAVVDGVARVCTRTLGDSEVTTHYARSGDALHVGVAPRDTVESWIEAVSDTTVALLPISRLRAAAAENPGLALLIAPPLDDADVGSAGLERHPTTARIAAHLLELAAMATPARSSANPVVAVTHLAVAAGVALSVASRTLSGLRRAGVVETRQDIVVVTDRKRLARIARGTEQIA
jgi:CRP-like cAMP-binding protein